MIVYRLENIESRDGPFSNGGPKTPWSWRHTHRPPDSGKSSSNFRVWRKQFKYRDKYLALPPRFIFSFISLELMHKCCPSFKEYPHLELLEIKLDLSKGKKHYCITEDGQVVFSKDIIISKKVIL